MMSVAERSVLLFEYLSGAAAFYWAPPPEEIATSDPIKIKAESGSKSQLDPDPSQIKKKLMKTQLSVSGFIFNEFATQVCKCIIRLRISMNTTSRIRIIVLK